MVSNELEVERGKHEIVRVHLKRCELTLIGDNLTSLVKSHDKMNSLRQQNVYGVIANVSDD